MATFWCNNIILIYKQTTIDTSKLVIAPVQPLLIVLYTVCKFPFFYVQNTYDITRETIYRPDSQDNAKQREKHIVGNKTLLRLNT